MGDNIIQRYLRYHGINPTLHYECDVPDPRSRPSGASGYWLDNLLQHCSDCGLMLKRGGHTTQLTSETPLVQLFPELRSLWIEEGLVCLGDSTIPVMIAGFALRVTIDITFHLVMKSSFITYSELVNSGACQGTAQLFTKSSTSIPIRKYTCESGHCSMTHV